MLLKVLANKFPIADDKNKFIVAVGSCHNRTKHFWSISLFLHAHNNTSNLLYAAPRFTQVYSSSIIRHNYTDFNRRSIEAITY